jgi:CO/xanthine dehydrogenase Mo-binding subunit
VGSRSARHCLGRLGDGGKLSDLAEGNANATSETRAGEEAQRYAMHASGAQFAEVRIDADLGKIRVSRFVGAFDAGRVMTAKTARSQLIGGIVYRLGMALLDETQIDGETGRVVNATIAEYLVPVNADVPIEREAPPPRARHIGAWIFLRKAARVVALAINKAASLPDRINRAPISM